MQYTKEVEQAANDLEAAAKEAKARRAAVIDALQIDSLIDDFKEIDPASDDLDPPRGDGSVTARMIWKHAQAITKRVEVPGAITGARLLVPCELFVAIKAMIEADRAHKVASDHFVAALGRSVAK